MDLSYSLRKRLNLTTMKKQNVKYRVEPSPFKWMMDACIYAFNNAPRFLIPGANRVRSSASAAMDHFDVHQGTHILQVSVQFAFSLLFVLEPRILRCYFHRTKECRFGHVEALFPRNYHIKSRRVSLQ